MLYLPDAPMQEESLRSKSKVLANIEELERLQPLLREARNEDKSQIEAVCKAQAASEAQAAAEEASASRIAELEAVRPGPSVFLNLVASLEVSQGRGTESHPREA